MPMALGGGEGGCDGGGGGGGGGGGRGRHDGEQRSGVATVVTMESRAQACSSVPHRLAALRCVVPKVLIGQEEMSSLEKIAESWLLSCPSSGNFGEECELVVTLLYTSLVLHDASSTLPRQELVFTFLERWVEDGGRMELAELANFLRPDWKCGATKVLFLLCANLMPNEWGPSVLQTDLSGWGNEWLPATAAPIWLLDAIGSTGDILDFVTLLRVSASLLQTDPVLAKVEWGYSYQGMMTKFLYAVSQYRHCEYKCSLDTFQGINSVVCEQRLQAWVSFFGGLCLAKIGKPHTALVKLQDAVDKSPVSIAALFNISKVFHSLGQSRAELEVLELLVKSGVDEKSSPASLHSSLLALHHTAPKGLSSRARYYLSCRLLHAKKFLEAAEHLEILLNCGVPPSESYGSTVRSLLRPEDSLPILPALRVLVVLAGVAYASMAYHKETIQVLDSKLLGEKDIGGSSFYCDPPNDKLRVVVTAAGQLLHAKALAGLGHVTEALRKCIRIEQAMWWVRGDFDGDDDGSSVKEWNVIILLIKSLLYKLMSDLHKTRNSHQNHHHYTRLPRQYLPVLKEFQVIPTWRDMSLSNQLAMDGIYEYFKNRSYKEESFLR